jgi:hypothetical protein
VRDRSGILLQNLQHGSGQAGGAKDIADSPTRDVVKELARGTPKLTTVKQKLSTNICIFAPLFFSLKTFIACNCTTP